MDICICTRTKSRNDGLTLLDKVESTAQQDCLVTMSPSLAPANMCGIAPSLMIRTQLRTSCATRHNAAQQYCHEPGIQAKWMDMDKAG